MYLPPISHWWGICLPSHPLNVAMKWLENKNRQAKPVGWTRIAPIHYRSPGKYSSKTSQQNWTITAQSNQAASSHRNRQQMCVSWDTSVWISQPSSSSLGILLYCWIFLRATSHVSQKPFVSRGLCTEVRFCPVKLQKAENFSKIKTATSWNPGYPWRAKYFLQTDIRHLRDWV